MDKTSLSKAGHYEIQGETIAKFEFFENGFSPYSRYLDVDKVDLILRKREKDFVRYIEVQVKYGRLYDCKERWSSQLFDVTCWKMFRVDEFKEIRPNLFVAVALAHPKGYQGDLFIFPSAIFHHLISLGIPVNTKTGKRSKFYIARSIVNGNWYLWRKWNFKEITEDTAFDVTQYRRNFGFTQ